MVIQSVVVRGQLGVARWDVFAKRMRFDCYRLDGLMNGAQIDKLHMSNPTNLFQSKVFGYDLIPNTKGLNRVLAAWRVNLRTFTKANVSGAGTRCCGKRVIAVGLPFE